jgi:hypothetical protein
MRKTVPKHELPPTPLPANVVKTLIDDEMVLGAYVFVCVCVHVCVDRIKK